CLGCPCIAGGCQKVVRSFTDERAGVRPDIFDAILAEPFPYLAQGVPVLFGMLILISDPGLSTRRLSFALAPYWIERNPPVPGHMGHQSPHAKRDARECVVEAHNDESSWPGQFGNVRERSAWIRRVMQYA